MVGTDLVLAAAFNPPNFVAISHIFLDAQPFQKSIGRDREFWGKSAVSEIGQRTDIGDETVCGRLRAQELVVRTIYYTVFGHRDVWDALERRSRRKDFVLCPRGIADSTAVRDLSRSTTSGDLAQIESGELFDERLRDSGAQPDYCMEQIA